MNSHSNLVSSFSFVLSILSTCSVAFSQVDELWVARYDGSAGGDESNAIAIDSDGNIYVTGRSCCGSLPPDGRSSSYATVKYSPHGEELWVAHYRGPYGGGGAIALALDSDRNVYVTGTSVGSGSVINDDYATVKYSSEGEELWVARYNGPADSVDRVNALALDSDGNVYVTGSSGTVKYDSEGNESWVAERGGIALTVDGEGNLFVTGGSGPGYATVKYSSQGEELWVARYNGPADSVDRVNALALDSDGNVYVTGMSGCWGFGQGCDYTTVKYSPEGQELWIARYAGPANPEVELDDDGASAIAIDNEGNVYVTGYSPGSGTGRDYATVKYSPTGEELWVARYDGPMSEDDYAHALALDSDGNVYVTGTSERAQWDTDYATVKYSSDGEELWVVRYGETEIFNTESAQAIALDREANVCVTGSSGGDYVTVKYRQGPTTMILPSDSNADGTLDLSDGISLLGHLFLGNPPELPCGDGTVGDPGNIQLVDANSDESIDLSDGIYVFSFLFLGSAAPALGTNCVPISGCPAVCTE